jgi:hypothetical protein
VSFFPSISAAIDRIQQLLRARAAPYVIIGSSVALLAPGLFGPLVLDDHVFELLARPDPGIAGFHSRPFDLLTFTTGVPTENRALMAEGALLPWYAHEQHLNALFRPLSVLTHRLDLALWKDNPVLMRAHSLLWFVLLLLAVRCLYESLELPRFASGLAFVIFALDDVHGPTVSWIANRNAILVALFGTLALVLHHRARTRSDKLAAGLAALCLAPCMLAAESGIVFYAYLFAYALCLDRRRGLAYAMLSLWPYAVVLVAWKLLYSAGGYGTFGSEVYIDPLRQPAGLLSALRWNLPALLASQFGPSIPFADLIFWAPSELRAPILVVALLVVACMGWLAYRALRTSAQCRFLALGLILAVVPVSASAAGDRHLLSISIGAAPLVAVSLTTLADPLLSGTHQRLPQRMGLALLVFSNLVVAPLALPLKACSLATFGRTVERADAAIPRTNAIRDKTVVVVNAPVDILVSYLQLGRARTDTPRPEHLYWLATASSPFTIARTSPTGLRVDKPLGFLHSLPERHYRPDWLPFSRGEEVQLGELRATVVELTPEGRPQRVDFRFREPLEAQRYVFLAWNGSTLVPWNIPADDTPRRFGAETLLSTLVDPHALPHVSD